MHKTQQSSHTQCTDSLQSMQKQQSVDRFCRQHISFIFKCTPTRPAKENDRSDGKMYSKCTVKCMGWGIPMHAHRARGVPASCWTHPHGDPVLLAPSPRLNHELYPHTRGFPVGPAGNPLSPSPCSSLVLNSLCRWPYSTFVHHATLTYPYYVLIVCSYTLYLYPSDMTVVV